MKTILSTLMAVAGCVCALAEPSVLEIGYKPPEKAEDAKPPATPEEMPAETAEEPAGEEMQPEVASPDEESGEEKQPKEEKHPKEAKQLTGRPAKITSDSTIYNRKEGIASFVGHVHVDDEQYQMHADRVYLFLEGTNELKRIVAIGNVAMTNETRRAYGAKATYSKKNGLVVLYSGDGITAEVRDESKEQPQIVRGKRIRFWVGSEQVEVDEADLTGAAPAGGADSLKKALGK
jgi:lipopolysaccharide transport protein LptA